MKIHSSPLWEKPPPPPPPFHHQHQDSDVFDGAQHFRLNIVLRGAISSLWSMVMMSTLLISWGIAMLIALVELLKVTNSLHLSEDRVVLKKDIAVEMRAE